MNSQLQKDKAKKTIPRKSFVCYKRKTSIRNKSVNRVHQHNYQLNGNQHSWSISLRLVGNYVVEYHGNEILNSKNICRPRSL